MIPWVWYVERNDQQDMMLTACCYSQSLAAYEEKDLVELMQEANKIPGRGLSRTAVRTKIKEQLMHRDACNRDSHGRYVVRPLTRTARSIIAERGVLQLPSNPWFVQFYKRHSGCVSEKPPEMKDVARTASLNKAKLEEDLNVLGRQCSEPDIAIMIRTAEGRYQYIENEEGDAKVGRVGGDCNRFRVIQVDEKGQVRTSTMPPP